MLRILVSATIGATLIGCAAPNRVSYSTVNAAPRAFVRRGPADVDVFVGKPPSRQHLDVGLFEVYQGSTFDGTGLSTEDMVRTLRLHAGLRGCDAVQLMGVELAGRGDWRVVRGVCEMYTDAQAQRSVGSIRVPFEPLPGEGTTCTPADPELGPGGNPLPPCPDPLVCSNKVCVSPYQ